MESNDKLLIELKELRKAFLIALNRVGALEGHPNFFTDKIVTKFMNSTFDYGRKLKNVDDKEKLWEEKEKQSLINDFSKAVNILKKYLFSAIDRLDYKNPTIQKTYKSAMAFLREDILYIYKALQPSENIFNCVKIELEFFKNCEKCLLRHYDGKHSILDTTYITIAHYWWRGPILIFSHKEIQKRRKIFLDILNGVANLSGVPRFHTNVFVKEFMWAIFEYARVCRIVADELNSWDQHQKAKFTKQFQTSLEQLENYLLPAIQSLDQNDPIVNNTYKSAIVFLRKNVFDLYKKCEPSKASVDSVKQELKSLKEKENLIPEIKIDVYNLPDLKGVPLYHRWWKDPSQISSAERIKTLRKSFLSSLNEVAKLPNDSSFDTYESVVDFIWATLDYGEARSSTKKDKPKDWNRNEKSVFSNTFLQALEKLKIHLLDEIKNQDKDDMVDIKTCESALGYLRGDIFEIYKEVKSFEQKLLDNNSLINKVGNLLKELEENYRTKIDEIESQKEKLKEKVHEEEFHKKELHKEESEKRKTHENKLVQNNKNYDLSILKCIYESNNTYILQNAQVRRFAIGIDLGTTNSAVGIWERDRVTLMTNKEGTRLTPSYVYYNSTGDLIGSTAKSKLSIEPANVFFDAKRLLAQNIDAPEVKRSIETWPFTVVGHPDSKIGKAHFVYDPKGKKTLIPPEQVSSSVLKSLLDDACRYLNAEPDNIEAVITVPAYFNTNQKRATKKAAEAAGINVREILSEPVAAALAYQLEMRGEDRLKQGESVFIFDLGGGTFDVTIMRIENDGTYKVIALGGDSHLGGRDFDQVIVDIMIEKLREQVGNAEVDELISQPRWRYRLMHSAHEIKESFTQTQVEYLALSEICEEAEDEELTIKEFEDKSKHLQEKIRKCCEDTLSASGMDARDINHVLLVGGASRMNMVVNILKKIFPEGTNLSKAVSGDEAIAIGATVYATKLLGTSESAFIRSLKVQDALPLPIKTKGKDNKLDTILNNNTSLPASNHIDVETKKDNESSISIPIYEGLSENIQEDNHIADIDINGIPLRSSGFKIGNLIIKCDENGNFSAQLLNSNIEQPIEFKINYKINFDCKMQIQGTEGLSLLSTTPTVL